KGLIIGAVVAAVVVVALVVLTIVMGTLSTNAYVAGDYTAAYNNSKLALFQAKGDKNIIAKAYVVEVLCKEGKYFTGAEIIKKSTLSDKEKAAIYKAEPELALCVPGQIVTFGKYEVDNNVANGAEDLEWIVLDVIKADGKARALLVTKDVVASPDGWNKLNESNASYANSNLNSWCEEFYSILVQNDVTLGNKLLKVSVETKDSGDPVAAYAYALSKADIETYFVDDLAQYIKATPTAAAKAKGVTAYGKDKTAIYYLRDAGKVEGGTQWACGINKEGVVDDGLSTTSGNYGARVCINVNLGEVK
ncbi:MAG: hypothetical protein IKU24_00790, partial [Clostridia bacterium]|nr:hypothetical protein [Clostridia bacterium]